MNRKIIAVAYVCYLMPATIWAMDTATNIQDPEALRAAIQASRIADQKDSTLFNLMPESDFINEDIYFQFDRGFYTRQNEHNIVTPTIQVLNDCFAQEVADAVLYSKIGGDNFIQNNRLRSYAYLCGDFMHYALTQTVNRILNSGYVPEKFYDVDESKRSVVSDANKKSIVRKLQHNAHTLKHFVATRSVSNYCKVYPEQVAFGLCALVGISYLLYRGYTGQQEPDTTDDESKNPLDTNQ